MGAQPGDCTDSNSFKLPSHVAENLTELQSAERIADHFAGIRSNFPPLKIYLLPDRVLNKLKTDTTSPPTLSEFEVWEKIKAANKPKSGVPGELPSSLVKEFSVELASPLETIINNIVKTAEWPQQWKLEYVTPIGKTTNPESEDDLRPISLTPFCSKVTEHFVVLWLLEYIEHLTFHPQTFK